ncbi:MAG: hypothetical protein QM753_02455 [Thermomicrobiales bacterium]
MALTITITNPHIIAIIERQAAERGISESDMVAETVDAAFAAATPTGAPKTRSPEEIAARKARALAILGEIHASITDEDRAFDYDAWLYDENGLPH